MFLHLGNFALQAQSAPSDLKLVYRGPSDKVTRSKSNAKQRLVNGHIAALPAQSSGGVESINGRAEPQTSVAGSSQKWPTSSPAEDSALNGNLHGASLADDVQLNGKTDERELQAQSSRDPQMVPLSASFSVWSLNKAGRHFFLLAHFC